jgi:hypothetical protein
MLLLSDALAGNRPQPGAQADVAAFIVANSPVASAYFALLEIYVGGLSILHWINDALMAVFFWHRPRDQT